MTQPKKIHILEGSLSDGRRVLGCGKKVQRDPNEHVIGCALLPERGYEVTCQRCRRRYALDKRNRE